MTHQILTSARLRELLHYDEKTGVFTRHAQSQRHLPVGTVPKNPRYAYLRICLDYKIYMAHRLAWLYVNGVWPDGQIDHINGNKLDNRIENLRDATPSQNKQNMRKARADSKSGLAGASWYSSGNKWRAAIQIDGKKKHLGYFDTAEEAHQVFMDAKRKHHSHCTV